MCSAGSLNWSASRPKPGILAVQPKPDGLNIVDRHLQRIARLGAFDKDRAGDRIDLAEIELRRRPRRCCRPCKLAARGIDAFELDRRAGRHPLGRGEIALFQPK